MREGCGSKWDFYAKNSRFIYPFPILDDYALVLPPAWRKQAPQNLYILH